MRLIEKIFQRNDKLFIRFYFFTIAVFLYLTSAYSYYLREGTFNLPEIYVLGSFLLGIIFIILGIARSRDNRYIIGTAQFFRIEFTILVEAFIICINRWVVFVNPGIVT